MVEQELPDGPAEFTLKALRAVLDKTQEPSLRITSLQVALLADQLLELGVVFPAAQALPELDPDDLLWEPLYMEGQLVNEQPRGGVLTHKPTGLTEVAGSERSQIQNKAVAIERLRRRLVVVNMREGKTS